MTERDTRLPRRLLAMAAAAFALVLLLGAPANAGVPRTTEWVCLVPQPDGSYEQVVFVSVPDAALPGITQANAHAGETFAANFGELCSVR